MGASAGSPAGSLAGYTGPASTSASPSAATTQDESTTYGGIEFAHLSFDDAVSRGERTKKILVILWVDDDQVKERTVATNVFGDEGVQRWMTEYATAVRINGSQRKKDAKKAGVAADRMPSIDILDIQRGGRIDRLREDSTATQFLAAVLGIGNPERPDGETAKEPFSWLGWANAKYRDGQDPDSGRLAVEGYGWCLRNAEAQRPGFRAKYLEFLLQRVALCKQRTPDAIRLLEREYTNLSAAIINGVATRADAYELTRVAFWLRKEDRIKDVFKNLRGGGENSGLYRRWLFATVAPILGRYEEYDEILDVVADKPLEMFQARIDVLLKDTAVTDEAGEKPAYVDDGTSTLPFAIQDSRADIIDDASWVYEALLSDGRGKDARDLMILITTTFPVNKAFGLFIERAQRLKLWGPSAEIADLGMAVLDERGQRRMQRLLGRIPRETPEGKPAGDGKKDGE
jgi:hypothetical protein